MPATIALIKFSPNKDGLICEDTSQTIVNIHIATDILNELTDKYETISRCILEEFDSSDDSVYEVFKDQDIESIIQELELKFYRSVLDIASDLDGNEITANPPDTGLILNDIALKKSRLQMQSLLEVISLFELKYEKYTDSSSVIRVGR